MNPLHEKLLFLSFILALLLCSSCKNTSTYGGKEMIGCHKVVSNPSSSTSEILNQIGTENIYLKLFKDNTFEIYTDINCCISNLKGKWKITRDLESEYFLIKIENGSYLSVPGLTFNGINCNGHSGYIIFDLKTIDCDNINYIP